MDLSGDSAAKKKESTNEGVSYNELTIIREMFREQMYLLSPKNERNHVCVNGSISLSEDLSNFTNIARQNKNVYLKSILEKEEDVKLKPVCVTEQEFENTQLLENHTIKEITVKIMQKFEEMEDVDKVNLLEEYFNKSVKGKNKNCYIDFYISLHE